MLTSCMPFSMAIPRASSASNFKMYGTERKAVASRQTDTAPSTLATVIGYVDEKRYDVDNEFIERRRSALPP